MDSATWRSCSTDSRVRVLFWTCEWGKRQLAEEVGNCKSTLMALSERDGYSCPTSSHKISRRSSPCSSFRERSHSSASSSSWALLFKLVADINERGLNGSRSQSKSSFIGGKYDSNLSSSTLTLITLVMFWREDKKLLCSLHAVNNDGWRKSWEFKQSVWGYIQFNISTSEQYICFISLSKKVK